MLEVPYVVLIPARWGSSRLPQKPLLDLAGLPMVVRVARQAMATSAQQVLVAADAGVGGAGRLADAPGELHRPESNEVGAHAALPA